MIFGIWEMLTGKKPPQPAQENTAAKFAKAMRLGVKAHVASQAQPEQQPHKQKYRGREFEENEREHEL